MTDDWIYDIRPQCSGSEFDGCQVRFPRQSGMFRDDLFDGLTRAKAFENTFHSDPGSGNHRFSHHDIGFRLDEIHGFKLPVREHDSSAIFPPGIRAPNSLSLG